MSYVSESTNVIQVILGIGLLIFIHELGHFLVAKKNRRASPRLFIGIWACNTKKAVGRNSTASPWYHWGYVKLAGEGHDEEKTGASWEFSSKTHGQRAAACLLRVSHSTPSWPLLRLLSPFRWVCLLSPLK